MPARLRFSLAAVLLLGCQKTPPVTAATPATSSCLDFTQEAPPAPIAEAQLDAASPQLIDQAVQHAVGHVAESGWGLYLPMLWENVAEGMREATSSPAGSWDSLSQHFHDAEWVTSSYADHRESIIAGLSASEEAAAIRLLLNEAVLPYFTAPLPAEVQSQYDRMMALQAQRHQLPSSEDRCWDPLHEEQDRQEAALAEITPNMDVLRWRETLRSQGGQAAVDAWGAVLADIAASLPTSPLVGIWGDEDDDNPLRLSSLHDQDGYIYRDAVTGDVTLPGPYQHARPFNTDGIADVILSGDMPRDGRPTWDYPQFVRINTAGEIIEQAVFRDNGHDYYVEGYARYIEGGKIGYSTLAGEHVIAAAFDWASVFSDGRALVCSGCTEQVTRPDLEEHNTDILGGMWGAIDATGAVVVPIEHDTSDAVVALLDRGE